VSGWSVLTATHASAASAGLLLGGYQLMRRVKGDRVHRVIGWIWVAAMLFVTTSSFAIRELRHGQLSLLHVLSVVTLVSLVIGVVAVRRGNVGRHRGAMRGSWFGLIGAFIGAVAVPERRVPTFAVTDPVGATLAAVTIVALTFGLIWLAHGFDRHFASSPDLGIDRPRTTETPAPTSGTVGAADAADA
jgi:uncharacterized membrane protein